MRVTGPFDSTARGSLKAPAAEARRIEKSSPSSQLGNAPRDEARPQEKAPRRLQVELVSHSGTSSFDPFWDGPRLRPQFVTQLLGQVMPQGGSPHRNPAIRTPYEAPALRTAMLVDRKG